MRERPMLFSAPLVRAILGDRKSQTRRLFRAANGGVWPNPNDKPAMAQILRACPHGQPGDRIYVRETFVQGYEEDPLTGCLKQCDEEGNDIPMTTWYRATNGGITWSDDGESEVNVPWKPAIHMPKSLARIWLEVTSVRVERLQQITEGDCIAEGAPGGHGAIQGYQYSATPLEHFEHLWESTGGDWAANPWVWVIDFKRINHVR